VWTRLRSKVEKAKRYLVAGSFFLHTGRFIKRTFLRGVRFIWDAPHRIRHRIDYAIGFLMRKIVFQRGPIQNNKVLVRTYDNRYSCNPKYIIEEVLRRELELDIVWVIPAKGKIPRSAFPPSVRLVRSGSYTMYREMASAKVWVDNALNCVWEGMPKKKGQVYINTWHGSLGIKRLVGGKTWMHRAKRCNRVTDYCISNSRFEEDVYHETFWRDVPYLRYGHARNDILFAQNQPECLRERVCSAFQLEPDVKILLYAPTFRDNGSMKWFNIDFERLKAALELRFGGEWCVLLRMHFKNQKKKAREKQEWLKNASTYADMQELLAVADAGITDYSSWAYDYILTKRPLFLYAPDMEKYDQERGFYYPLESTPFSIATDNDALEENILSFDEPVYRRDCDVFLEEKGCAEDGYASSRIVDRIVEWTGVGGAV